MKYTKHTKTEHSLECTGDELQQFYQGELRLPDGEVLDPEDNDLTVAAIIPSGGDYSGMLIPMNELKFSVTWDEEHEDTEED